MLNASKRVSEYSLSQFVTKAVVVDVRDYLKNSLFQALDENNMVPVDVFGDEVSGIRTFLDHLTAMEITKSEFLRRCNTKVKGMAVLFCTGLDRYWKFGKQSGWRYAYFLNPFLSRELAEYLVNEGVSLIGSDSLQLESPLFNISPKEDFPTSKDIHKYFWEVIKGYADRPVHNIFLEGGICIVENLKNLEQLLPGPVIFVAAPLKLADVVTTDNSPTRAFALVPRGIKG